jgi:hypothetical protein
MRIAKSGVLVVCFRNLGQLIRQGWLIFVARISAQTRLNVFARDGAFASSLLHNNAAPARLAHRFGVL